MLDSAAGSPASSPSADPAPGPAGGEPAAPVPAPAPAPATPAPEGGAPAPAAGDTQAAAPKLNITARLAALSGENRRTAADLRKAEVRAAAAEAKAAEFESLAAKAQTGDPAAIRGLHERFNVAFEKVVDAYADAGAAELTPEQKLAAQVEAHQKRLDADAAEKEKDKQVALERSYQNSVAEAVAGVAQAIQAKADKFEICARLGEEAARAVYTEVFEAWKKAGNPDLMPGEYDEAVQTAAELVELRYEEQGKKLAKTAKPATNGNGAHAPAATNSDLPAGLIAGPLSDKDEDILKGLIDKTAPAFGSQRAKPRTISSELGGSAPPPTPPRGAMDARAALRETLSEHGLVGR